jgi:HSP90 family molecular chaperone
VSVLRFHAIAPQHLTEFQDIKLVNVAKEDVDMSDDKAAAKEVKDAYKPLVKWWKALLGDTANVKVRARVASGQNESHTHCI